jgi:phosphoglycolate phosphatase
MTFRAVLFDLDGTLLDTLRDIADTANAALARLGFPPHEVEAYKLFVGEGEGLLARRVLPPERRTDENAGKLLSLMHEDYPKRWLDNTHIYSGVPEMLDSLAGRGVGMAILSNKSQEFARSMVSRLLERWDFACVVGASASIPNKPDPTGAKLIADKMKIRPGEFVYLGDSAVDMKAAVGAAMNPVGALWGYRNADELLGGGAEHLISHPSQLLDLAR